MRVVATAGHVDHGKSTLVRALTGMEPDRWAEERRRGLTIDLGYAWTTLASGEQLAFVDVPGHERFIANMLAGLGPAPAVLFVVAADEGWCAQSEEHLAAADALDIRHGLLAVTRSDLADPAAALDEASARLARSSLGDVAAVTVSGRTGAGLPELRAALDRFVAELPAPDPDARVRLWIDRAFTIRGSGTVVTGTLAAGTVAVGDELELDGRRVQVRELQSAGRSHGRLGPVARVALNLRGVSHHEVRRGDVLLAPGAWHRTATADVRITCDEELPAELLLHIGTAAVPVRLRPLGPGLARVTLPRPLPLQVGDRAVLRDPGRHAVTGALVLDADPPALTRRGAAARRAAELRDRHARPDAAAELARRGAVRRSHLQALGIPVENLDGAREVAGWLIAAPTWRDWVTAAPDAVAGWATREPLDPAMPTAALARALRLPDPALVGPLVAAAGLTVRAGRVQAASTPTSLGPAEAGVAAIEQRLHDEPFAAPDSDELARHRLGRRELAAAERAGRLLRISPEIVLLPSAPDIAVERLRTLPQPFTTSQARQALGTTRRVAIPLLEYLDAQHRTERVDPTTRRVPDTGEAAADLGDT
ncbi:MAG TPA: selenocysteine-specific translation elongation factor [Jatrophihabitans sp.]|nr:selenocysteine-specific translation elongation factor [Jatrophihabitans sp.]